MGAFKKEGNKKNTSLLDSDKINYETFHKLKNPKSGKKAPISVTKRRTIKNLLVLGTCFFFSYLGFEGLANLQSTMNAKQGVGLDSEAVIYGFAMLSTVFLPKMLLRCFGCKNTLLAANFMASFYIVANYFPYWQTLIPTAVLHGLAVGPLLTAQSFYIGELSTQYTEFVTDSLEVILARFYGVFSFFVANTQIWGNFISFYVLESSVNSNVTAPATKTTPSCGIAFQASDILSGKNYSNPNLKPPTNNQRYTLVSVYVLLAVLAIILIKVFLDPLKCDTDIRSSGDAKNSLLENLLAAIKQLRNRNQILLLPIAIYCGAELAFYSGNFTQAYIACAKGIDYVGIVTMVFGVADALTALQIGSFVKATSQAVVFFIAALINLVGSCILFFWEPGSESTASLFLFGSFWGIADAVWWSQIIAFYGLAFPNNREAALSNFYFWNNFGYLLTYLCANYFDIRVKIYILISLLTVGMIGLGSVLVRSKNMWNSKSNELEGNK